MDISVIIVTYNQVNYIEQCVESVLSQTFMGSIEVIIGDDCSTDGTREVLEKYRDDPRATVRLMLHEKNKGGKGSGNFLYCLDKITGKYAALIEGDDYWTNENKLALQYEFMEKNPQIAGCFHDSITVDEKNNVIKESYLGDKLTQEEFTQEDCIRILKSSYSTGSVFFRSSIAKPIPRWFLLNSSDYALDLLITESGNLRFLNANMSAYRIHGQGIWMGKSYHENLTDLVFRYIKFLRYNRTFRNKYGEFYRNEIRLMDKAIQSNYRKFRAIRTLLRYKWNKFKIRFL